MKATKNTTAREYKNSYELLREAKNEIRNGAFNDPQIIELEDQVKIWNEKYFNRLPKVNVSFMCGYRMFYREVVKIGKSYFDSGEKMTKNRGYHCVEEIEKITDRMKEDMISDSYYY